MKRSEAIKLLAKMFEEHSNNQQYKGYSHEGLADTFLDLVAEIGMLPPEHIIYDSGQFPGDSFMYKTRAWGSEDEEI